MKASMGARLRPVGSCAAAVIVAALVSAVSSRGLAQVSPASGTADAGFNKSALQGVPYDWSHHHVIFSHPASRSLEDRLEREPRYQMQRAWRNRQASAGSAQNYMQTLDEMALQLSAAGKKPPSAAMKPMQPAARKHKLPAGAWAESMNVAVNNANGNASYPAKFAFSNSSSCTDWVAFTVPVAGSATQFNLFAFKNLYTSTCGGPTLKFVYNASEESGPLVTSPVISLAGDQIAMVETQPEARLDVVKFSDVTSPPTFPTPNPTSLASCGTAPCVNSLAYNSQAAATLSAPFYDYTTGQDTAYVSADDSTVWAINPVFTGPLNKKTGWAAGVAVNSNTVKLTAPVYDSVSQNVFVGDSTGNLYYVRTQSTSAGTCKGVKTGTPCLGDTPTTLNCTGPSTPSACCTGSKLGCNGLKVSSKAIIEPIILDSSTEKVFVFSNGNPNTSGTSVVQTDVQLSILNVASIGTGTTNTIHEGTFDNKYFTGDPSTGHLYVCGQDSTGTPQLYSFGFTDSPTAGTLSTSPVGGPIPLATGSGAGSAKCSPLTEDFDGTTDRLFVAVSSGCPASTASTSSGCVAAFNITSGFPSFTTPPYSVTFSQNASLATTGTGGIIIDNTTGTSNQTNIYFETQGASTSCSTYNGGTANGSCAVSLTQSSLN